MASGGGKRSQSTPVRGGGLSERQERIVEAAMGILAQRGPRGFTVQVLASELGVTGGAIYRHFGSMESIVDAVVDRMGEILFESFPPTDEDPIERLRHFFLQRIRAIQDNGPISRLLLSDYLAQAAGAKQAERLEEFKRRTRSFVLECLREAAGKGILREGLSPDAGAVILIGAILTLAHAGERAVSAAKARRLCEEVWWALDSMLRAPTEPEKATSRALRQRRQ